MVTTTTFTDVITSLEQLREIVPPPREAAIKKDIGVLDDNCRAMIARSPFVLLATSGSSGACDVSPKGDAPGFVRVLDEHTLVLPDRPGNRRLDSYSNIIENPHVGLIFLIPGMEETLRVNGGGQIVRDEAILERCAVDGKRPQLAIAVDVQEAYIHCPKCFLRSKLWDTTTWRPRSELPSMGAMMVDMLKMDIPVETVEQALDEAHKKLY
jgi:PPOX class probable FMN-dependent enzyme